MKTVAIHYPSGGFGNFINVLCSITFPSVFCPTEEIAFSETGNSHRYPFHIQPWRHYKSTYDAKVNYDVGDKFALVLIDSGIENDDVYPIYKKFNDIPIIRMCIDDKSKSIITQTCKIKAENLSFNFDLKNNWEIREQFSLIYRYIDDTPDCVFNNFKPISNCININISDLFYDIDKVVHQLSFLFGSFEKQKYYDLHRRFIVANGTYNKANQLVDCVEKHLADNTSESLYYYDSLHDQGYLNYWLSKKFKLKEIPPWDYRNWFSNVDEIRSCIDACSKLNH